jgi:hypothetical protein
MRIYAARGGCGSELTEEEVLAAEQEFTNARGSSNSTFSAAAALLPSIEIEVHWHVVATNITIEGGWIP